MGEEYKIFFAGACAGILTLLFLQISVVLFGLRKVTNKKKYTDIYHRDLFSDPPRELLSLLGIATKECTDLAWLNISLQRFFYELTKSSTFFEKVKSTMVKKLSIAFSSGILKRIRFKDVSFGSEAPYIKSIKALSKSEVDKILKNKETDNNQPGSPAYFKQVYLLITIDYTSKDSCIYIDADLIKGYSIPIMVKLLPFKGDLLLRMPANNYSTRLEISFVKNPGFDFSVDAAFSKNDSVFFSNSLSHIIKRICKYIAKMYVFPNWYYYYMPMLVSRSRFIQYSYYPIVNESIDGPMQQVREIQNLFSLDYSITAKKGNIIYRKTKSTVNQTNSHLERAEIEIPIEKIGLIEDLFNNASSLDIFSDVISDYEGLKITKKYSSGVDKINIFISGSSYEFIRIIVEDLIIFQLANSEEPQFIALKREPYHVAVIQYVNTSEPFYLGKFRVTKLAKKLEKQEMKILGSTKLFKFIDYSVKQAEKTKKIFKNNNQPLKKTDSQKSINSDFIKDKYKEKYVTDGYSTAIEEAISEVSIIESHFRTIEDKLKNEHTDDYFRIDLPYTAEELKTALDDSLIRSAVLGSFVIMEDILLTDSIRNTSMAQSPSGQYVQLLSYSSRETNLIIERILLSEDYQGVTAAIKIFTGHLEVFIFGSIGNKRSFNVFADLIIASIEKKKVLSVPGKEIQKNYSETIAESSGIVLRSDTPVPCTVTVEREGKVQFSEEVHLFEPFTFLQDTAANIPFKITIKPKKKSKLSLSIIPKGAARESEVKVHHIKHVHTEKEDLNTEEETETEDEVKDSLSSGSETATPQKTNEDPASSYEMTRSNQPVEYAQIEGHILVKKKGKVTFPMAIGLVFWNTPWAPLDKNKPEDISVINGSGCAIRTSPGQLFWKNTEGKESVKKVSFGYVQKPLETTSTQEEPTE